MNDLQNLKQCFADSIKIKREFYDARKALSADPRNEDLRSRFEQANARNRYLDQLMHETRTQVPEEYRRWLFPLYGLGLLAAIFGLLWWLERQKKQEERYNRTLADEAEREPTRVRSGRA